MTDDELLPIGHFARLTGLTIHALRHYDEVGLLPPADVDPVTGYRRYSGEQAVTARLIADLRWLDLPIQDIRQVLADPSGPHARATLERHRDRLARGHGHLSRQLGTTTRYLDEGITMRTTTKVSTPVQVKITVDDLDAARALYAGALGFTEQVVRHTDDADYRGFQFGEYGQPGFFLIHLVSAGGPELDRPAQSTFGLLVADLDAVHAAALAAGAAEAIAPQDRQGMPRHSAVRDGFGNWIWLYQS
jgi:DNA-binding transcriptional MerR regulator